MRAIDRAARIFEQNYESTPSILVRAPGRVNLIGDHTDYNAGFVLPMAIDADIVIAATKRPDRAVHVVSESRADPASFELTAITRQRGWAEYLKGIAVALQPDRLAGWDGAIAGDLPAGAGLASSAALELATARVFAELSSLQWDPTAMALAAQQAENDWVGMNSGIMDQLIAATGRAGHARLIDCSDLSGRDVPIPDTATVVLLDTSTRRRLVDSAYNDRRAACEDAATRLGVESLREVDAEAVAAAGLPAELERRARHVVTENHRTTRAAEALLAGDLVGAGELMKASHASLRDDFEVSSAALDAMAQAAWTAPGCYGARQTGGGFAGSCVALVAADDLEGFTAGVLAAYTAATGRHGTARACQAVDGAQIV